MTKITEKSSEMDTKEVLLRFAEAKDDQNLYKMIKEYINLEDLQKELPTNKTKISQVNSELFVMYCNDFPPVSQKIEKWASHRRLLLKSINSSIDSVTKTKLYTSKSKIVCSAIDVVGTSASLVLCNFQKSYATTLLYTSAGFGCLSFISSMFDLMKTSSTMEQILKELRKDAEYLDEIQRLLQKMYDFDRNVQKLFPYGIDAQVVKLIQKPYTARRSNIENYQDVMKSLSETSEPVQMFLSVLLTNMRKNPELLKDKEFMSNVKEFAKSSIGEIWWNRMKHHGMFPIANKSKLFTYLNSFSRMESMPIRTFPLLSSPVWHLNGFPTVGAIFLNSMVVFDSYCDLIQNGKTRETEILQELQQTLQVEYKNIMDVYQQLTPYTDE